MIFHPMMLIAAALAALYGAAYCWRDRTDWTRSAVKTGSMALLALAAWQLHAPTLIILGLGFGALGDLCLSRPGKTAFLAGMAAFALGHLAYATFLFGLWNGPHLWAMLALLLLAASTEGWLAPHTGPLCHPVRGYVAVITLMGIAALGQSAPLLLLGAGLFILSDVLLALARFVWPDARFTPTLAIALWPAYWLGQFFILQGALST